MGCQHTSGADLRRWQRAVKVLAPHITDDESESMWEAMLSGVSTHVTKDMVCAFANADPVLTHRVHHECSASVMTGGQNSTTTYPRFRLDEETKTRADDHKTDDGDGSEFEVNSDYSEEEGSDSSGDEDRVYASYSVVHPHAHCPLSAWYSQGYDDVVLLRDVTVVISVDGDGITPSTATERPPYDYMADLHNWCRSSGATVDPIVAVQARDRVWEVTVSVRVQGRCSRFTAADRTKRQATREASRRALSFMRGARVSTRAGDVGPGTDDGATGDDTTHGNNSNLTSDTTDNDANIAAEVCSPTDTGGLGSGATKSCRTGHHLSIGPPEAEPTVNLLGRGKGVVINTPQYDACRSLRGGSPKQRRKKQARASKAATLAETPETPTRPPNRAHTSSHHTRSRRTATATIADAVADSGTRSLDPAERNAPIAAPDETVVTAVNTHCADDAPAEGATSGIGRGGVAAETAATGAAAAKTALTAAAMHLEMQNAAAAQELQELQRRHNVPNSDTSAAASGVDAMKPALTPDDGDPCSGARPTSDIMKTTVQAAGAASPGIGVDDNDKAAAAAPNSSGSTAAPVVATTTTTPPRRSHEDAAEHELDTLRAHEKQWSTVLDQVTAGPPTATCDSGFNQLMKEIQRKVPSVYDQVMQMVATRDSTMPRKQAAMIIKTTIRGMLPPADEPAADAPGTYQEPTLPFTAFEGPDSMHEQVDGASDIEMSSSDPEDEDHVCANPCVCPAGQGTVNPYCKQHSASALEGSARSEADQRAEYIEQRAATEQADQAMADAADRMQRLQMHATPAVTVVGSGSEDEGGADTFDENGGSPPMSPTPATQPTTTPAPSDAGSDDGAASSGNGTDSTFSSDTSGRSPAGDDSRSSRGSAGSVDYAVGNTSQTANQTTSTSQSANQSVTQSISSADGESANQSARQSADNSSRPTNQSVNQSVSVSVSLSVQQSVAQSFSGDSHGSTPPGEPCTDGVATECSGDTAPQMSPPVSSGTHCDPAPAPKQATRSRSSVEELRRQRDLIDAQLKYAVAQACAHAQDDDKGAPPAHPEARAVYAGKLAPPQDVTPSMPTAQPGQTSVPLALLVVPAACEYLQGQLSAPGAAADQRLRDAIAVMRAALGWDVASPSCHDTATLPGAQATTEMVRNALVKWGYYEAVLKENAHILPAQPVERWGNHQTQVKRVPWADGPPAHADLRDLPTASTTETSEAQASGGYAPAAGDTDDIATSGAVGPSTTPVVDGKSGGDTNGAMEASDVDRIADGPGCDPEAPPSASPGHADETSGITTNDTTSAGTDNPGDTTWSAVQPQQQDGNGADAGDTSFSRARLDPNTRSTILAELQNPVPNTHNPCKCVLCQKGHYILLDGCPPCMSQTLVGRVLGKKHQNVMALYRKADTRTPSRDSRSHRPAFLEAHKAAEGHCEGGVTYWHIVKGATAEAQQTAAEWLTPLVEQWNEHWFANQESQMMEGLRWQQRMMHDRSETIRRTADRFKNMPVRELEKLNMDQSMVRSGNPVQEFTNVSALAAAAEGQSGMSAEHKEIARRQVLALTTHGTGGIDEGHSSTPKTLVAVANIQFARRWSDGRQTFFGRAYAEGPNKMDGTTAPRDEAMWTIPEETEQGFHPEETLAQMSRGITAQMYLPKDVREASLKHVTPLVDADNCFFVLVYNLTPDCLKRCYPKLMQYALDRDTVIDELSAACDDTVTKPMAKQLFLSLLFGAETSNWEHMPHGYEARVEQLTRRIRGEIVEWKNFVVADSTLCPEVFLEAGAVKVLKRMKACHKATVAKAPRESDPITTISPTATPAQMFSSDDITRLISNTAVALLLQTVEHDLMKQLGAILRKQYHVTISPYVFDECGFHYVGRAGGMLPVQVILSGAKDALRSLMRTGTMDDGTSRNWLSTVTGVTAIPILPMSVSNPGWNVGPNGEEIGWFETQLGAPALARARTAWDRPKAPAAATTRGNQQLTHCTSCASAKPLTSFPKRSGDKPDSQPRCQECVNLHLVAEKMVTEEQHTQGSKLLLLMAQHATNPTKQTCGCGANNRGMDCPRKCGCQYPPLKHALVERKASVVAQLRVDKRAQEQRAPPPPGGCHSRDNGDGGSQNGGDGHESANLLRHTAGPHIGLNAGGPDGGGDGAYQCPVAVADTTACGGESSCGPREKAQAEDRGNEHQSPGSGQGQATSITGAACVGQARAREAS